MNEVALALLEWEIAEKEAYAARLLLIAARYEQLAILVSASPS
jgi:hypothetical protein